MKQAFFKLKKTIKIRRPLTLAFIDKADSRLQTRLNVYIVTDSPESFAAALIKYDYLYNTTMSININKSYKTYWGFNRLFVLVAIYFMYLSPFIFNVFFYRGSKYAYLF
jgi:hypothetical protein